MESDPGLDTQAKLAAKSKVAQPHISRILRGTSGATIDAIAALARAFACQPWELLIHSDAVRREAVERMLGHRPQEIHPAMPHPSSDRPPKRIAHQKRRAKRAMP